MDEERVLWTGHPSHKKDLGFHLICWALCWLIVPLVMSLIRFLETRTHHFEVTSERIRVTSGILSRHMEELELYRVKDLDVIEPFWYRLFGLGNVNLDTSDRSNPLLTIEAIKEPRQLADAIRNQVEALRLARGVREIDMDVDNPGEAHIS